MSQIILRPYQRVAVDAVWQHIRTRDDNPCVVIPTAGGKTPVMAELCREAVGLWQGRVLILAHVKELLEQARDKLNAVCPEIKAGVYSAGLGSRDTAHSVIIAGIQSVYRKAQELGHFDLCLVDECHLIPGDGEGMYRKFLLELKAINPLLRVIGLTATPYRLASGMICGPDNILQKICFEVGVKELIRDGYLCPLVSKAGTQIIDVGNLHVRAGEYKTDEVEKLMDNESVVRAAVAEIMEYTQERRACLLFASSVAHGERIVRVFRNQHEIECGFVTGDTPPQKRSDLLARFRGEEVTSGLFDKQPPLKYLCNVNVLTTGFDAPNIDCVALLRPTMSPGLFYQMCGRGFRLHPDKQNCLILDYGDNVRRHGPVDQITAGWEPPSGNGGVCPGKECPQCHSVVSAGCGVCPDCGFVFPPVDAPSPHNGQASSDEIISSGKVTFDLPVTDTHYYVHHKRGAGDDYPRSVRVEYWNGPEQQASEWVCPEHIGYARSKFEVWWEKRSHMAAPHSASEAVTLANAGALCEPSMIAIRKVKGEKYDRIVGYELGAKPDPVNIPLPREAPVCASDSEDDFSDFRDWPDGLPADDDIPF